ncbi:hypothetical protein BX600DRAFT_443126 [Xylariales sp. PMI_506]|nr:hypothetical protein BX600DRAFT_443126 [Xylariales sp. PMI_506]
MQSAYTPEKSALITSSDAVGHEGSTTDRKSRKSRLRFSCTECRKKKLSCDRGLPCHRCVRTGRADKCTFETAPGQAALMNTTGNSRDRRHSEEVRQLQIQVAELKELLVKTASSRDALDDSAERRDRDLIPPSVSTQPAAPQTASAIEVRAAGLLPGLADPKLETSTGYYSRHSVFRFFADVRGIFPLIREIENEWFKPLNVRLSTDKSLRASRTTYRSQKTVDLESLLPPKEDADVMVAFYLNHMEQLHRVVHIPTFQREYNNFWIPDRARHPAMTALVLTMISISHCAPTHFSDVTAVNVKYRIVQEQWIEACDDWLRRQGTKHRKLIHYQIACLSYFAKRAHSVRKKRYWNDASSMIHDAIIDNLNLDASSMSDTPYIREIKRRIWCVLKEADLQNAFEYGLPTLLHCIDTDVAPPANVDDADFDETSQELPQPKPLQEYTFTSYQVHSTRSWALRLEISQRLFSPRFSKEPLSYEEVVRYTHEVTRAIDALPSWGVATTPNGQIPLLAHTYLHVQLHECIIALHRPYVGKKEDGKYWLSEMACYQAARDILLLNHKLAEMGMQSLAILRDQCCLAVLCLVHLTVIQPKGSSGIITSSTSSTLDLLESCLPSLEDDYQRSGGPWCFLTMCAAIMILKIHLGLETRKSAKEFCARRFLDMYYRNMGKKHQQMGLSVPSRQNPVVLLSGNDSQPHVLEDFKSSEWLGSTYPELSVDTFDLNMSWNLSSRWDMCDPMWDTDISPG